MKLKKFLCLFLLIAAVFALASCDILFGATTPEVVEYEVKFDSRGGSEVASQTIKEGGYVTEPKEPTREGYSFDGWYWSRKEWDFNKNTVTRSITLVANWKPVSTHEHDFSAPTCTEPATCECGETIGTAAGHKWVDATCTAPKTCSVCSLTEGNAKGHNEVISDAKAPTCTTTGLTQGKYCSDCDKVFVKQEIVPATGHTPVTDVGTDPTCTEPGLTAGSHCDVCGDTIVAQTIVPATGHTVVTDDKVDPTCTETGLTAGSHCDVCGEIIVAQTIVPATGHTEVKDNGKDATCTEPGLTEGSHCSVCDAVIVEQTEIPATGHTNAAPVVENNLAPTCDDAGSYDNVVYCSVCKVEISREKVTVDPLGHDWNEGEVTTEPGCETEGVKTYTCKNDASHTYTEPVAPTGHKYVDGVCTGCGQATSHTVNYYIDGELVYSEKFTEAEGLASLYNYTKVGYEFLGWSDGFDTVTSIPANTSTDVDLYGEIEAIEYTITYVVDGETYETATYTISDVALALINVPAKDGYNGAWVNAEGEVVTELAAGTIGDVTVTANYEEIIYKVTYELNGGVNDARNVTEYPASDVPELYAPESRNGYTFEGWFIDADFSGSAISSLEDAPAGDITLYAKWAVIDSTITPEAPF